MRVSRFDSISSWLTTWLLLLAIGVMTLFVLWLCSREGQRIHAVSQIERMETSHAALGVDQGFELPSETEVSDLQDPSFTEALVLVSSIAAELPKSQAMGQNLSKRGRPDGKDGSTLRGIGPGEGDDDIVPRWQRWELRFESQDKDDYAAQLDYFGIELGVFGGGQNHIESASSLSKQPKRTVNAQPKTEKRLYFSWAKQTIFSGFDRQLLAKAEISTEGRHVVRFVPPELEVLLADLEREHCETNLKSFPQSIQKTVFQCQTSSDQYEFVVASQQYR
ncbi:hypothetical protein [Rhodopirellula sp. MGV]|uniref:hypothetical protein n=1 Tax=Rhodopirellula sp. MGV TaxID=2023130 RepID=UPI000B96958A|nr:hypothetical protein [Rhodopirellula sp. MGV]PNY35476.1 hypothetical protein C2E31_18425 [Rhodopirellula baltica]